MTDVIWYLFVDFHPSKAKPSLSLDGMCFLIASTVSECSTPAKVAKGAGEWKHQLTA